MPDSHHHPRYALVLRWCLAAVAVATVSFLLGLLAVQANVGSAMQAGQLGSLYGPAQGPAESTPGFSGEAER